MKTIVKLALLAAGVGGVVLLARSSDATPKVSPPPPITPGYLALPGDIITVPASAAFADLRLPPLPAGARVTAIYARVTSPTAVLPVPPDIVAADATGYAYVQADGGVGAGSFETPTPMAFPRSYVTEVFRNGVRVA